MTADNDPREEPGVDENAEPADESKPASDESRSDEPARADTEPAADESAAIADQPDEPGKQSSWDSERVALERGRLDIAIVVLVLAIGGLLASFPARDSGVWRHLAVGRLIAERSYTFGDDPFSSAGASWINHSWLFDLKFFELVHLLGGPETSAAGTAVVVVQALMMMFLAWVMMSIRRADQGWWLPALGALLALLAMSPALRTGPQLVSYLFLGFTLYFLTRPQPNEQPAGVFGRLVASTPLCLFVLFAMWVNMDEWFVLGPITVLLFAIGETIQGARGAPAGGHKTLWLALAAGVLGCLINPYHVHAFTVPGELMPGFLAERAQPGLFDSALRPGYLGERTLGLNMAGFAYLPLILAGILSFVLNLGEIRWWRVLLFAAYLILSVRLAAAVPFFAVVAGPILALNLQDFAARQQAQDSAKRASLAGRFLTGLALAFLTAALVLGWQGVQPAGRQLAWKIEADPAFVRAAWQLDDLRRRGVLQAGGFNLVPEIGDYCAWFAPHSRCFVNSRCEVYPEAVNADLRDVRAELASPDKQQADPAVIDRVFANPDRPLDHIIVAAAPGAENGIDTAIRTMGRLWSERDRWTMLTLAGSVAVFAYHNPDQPAQAERFRADRYDPLALAFGPRPSVPRAVPLASDSSRPPGVDESRILIKFDESFHQASMQRSQRVRLIVHHCDYRLVQPAAVLSALAISGPAAPIAAAVRSTTLPAARGSVILSGERLYGLPMLSARAARRAVRSAPDNADAQLAHAAATIFLWQSQRQRVSNQSLIDQLRQVQIVSALARAAQLAPEDSRPHRTLAQLFLSMRVGERRPYIDRALAHAQESMRLLEEAGPNDGETTAEFEKRLAERRQQFNLDKLAEEITKRRTTYDLESAGKPFGARVGLAVELGLSRTAIEVLDENIDDLKGNPQALHDLLMLKLMGGQLDEVKAHTGYDQENQLDSNFDPWTTVLIAAAAGDLERADGILAGMIQADLHTREQALLMQGAELGLRGQVNPQNLFGLSNIVRSFGRQADLRTLRGLLALDRGDNSKARKQFRAALGIGFPLEVFEASMTIFAARDPLSRAAPFLLQQRNSSFNFPYARLARYYLSLFRLAADRDAQALRDAEKGRGGEERRGAGETRRGEKHCRATSPLLPFSASPHRVYTSPLLPFSASPHRVCLSLLATSI